jgi:uncharacterized protein with LGFP repeats
VCDPGEYTIANPWTNWSRSFSASELTSRLSPYTGGIGTVTGFPKVRRGSGGRIVHATVHGSGGNAVVTGTEIRAALALPDDRVWINGNKNVVGAIRAKYDGLDCAPGLPTSTTATLHGGARQRFRTGAIYRNSLIDVTVWLKGAIYGEYLGVGGATGHLGLPTTQLGGVAASQRAPGGKRMVFQHGRIYWKAGPGAHALWGKLLKVYLTHGGATGALGFPTTRLHGSGGDTSADFEHGHILCPSGRACQVTVT